MKILAAFLIVSLLACSDYDQFDPYGNINDDLAFLQPLKPGITHKTIDPKRVNTLSTADSVLLDIPDNAFMDHFNAAYSGDIDFSFQMLTKTAHLIAYDLSLVDGNGNLIIPEAIFHTAAYTPNGHLLSLKEGKKVQVKYPLETAFSPLELYFPDNPEIENDLDVWLKADPVNQDFGIYEETWSWKSKEGEIRQSSGLLINGAKLKWLALGASLETEDGCELCLTTQDEFNFENTRVFAIGRSFPFFLKLEWNEERHAFCDKNNRIPIESEIRIVSISKIGSQLYLDKKTLFTETIINSTITPEKIERDELLEYLINL